MKCSLFLCRMMFVVAPLETAPATQRKHLNKYIYFFCKNKDSNWICGYFKYLVCCKYKMNQNYLIVNQDINNLKLCIIKLQWGVFHQRQSHYREVERWEIYMEQKLRFGLDLGQLALLKKNLGRLWAVFSCFHGQKK